MMVAEGYSRTSGSLASSLARLVAVAAAFTVAAIDVVSSEFEQRSVVALSGEPNSGGSREKEKEQCRRLQVLPVKASGGDDVAAVSRFIFPGKWRRRRCRSISRERGVKGDSVAGEASDGGRWWRLRRTRVQAWDCVGGVEKKRCHGEGKKLWLLLRFF